jgi:hypothetical protein
MRIRKPALVISNCNDGLFRAAARGLLVPPAAGLASLARFL